MILKMKNLLIILIICIPPLVQSKTLPALEVSSNQRYIVSSEKAPFFWLGDTAWELIHRLNREEIDLYLKDRSEKGFTVIQTVILAEIDGLNTPNAYGDKPLIDNDPTQLNEKYFEHVDYVLSKAEEYGLYVGLLPTWGDKFNLKWGKGPVIFNSENAGKYGELVAQRYHKRSNIIWILGGDRLPETDEQYAVVRAMAKGIRKVDQQNLMTYHPKGDTKATDAFNDEWLQLDMFQSGHSRDTKDYEFVWNSKKITPVRPIINGEPRYENISEKFWDPGVHTWLADSDVRVCAYWSMFAGGAGYTYGCNDIWQMYDVGREPVIKARTGWKEAMQLPGARQMKYVKALFEYFLWQETENDQSLILNKNPENPEFQMALMANKKDFILAYTPWGNELVIDLPKMDAEKIVAYWFNPRSGDIAKVGEYSTNKEETFKPWSNGRGSDFVLILLDESSIDNYPNFN